MNFATIKDSLLQKVKPGSFLRSVLTIASGTVIAQAIAVLVSPIITRLFTPEDMGVLASFTAIVSILGTVATGCYDHAIVLPDTDKESNAVAFASLSFSVIFSFVITLVSIIFFKPLTTALKLNDMAASWFYLLGLFVLLTGFELVLNRVAIRNRHFKVLASTQVTQQISSNSIKIAFGFLKSGSIGLFLGTFFGLISRVIRLGVSEFKIIFSKDNRPAIQDVKKTAVRYKKFPLVSSWSGLLNSSSVQLPVILFASLFSPAVAGFYSLSHRILSLPMSLIGQSVGNVFLERAAKAKDNNAELGRITLDIYSKLILIGSIIMSFVVFYGDLLFPFVFGEQWLEAGKYAQWMAIWMIFQLASSPISTVFIVAEKQGLILGRNLLLFLSRISFILFIPFFDNVLIIIIIYSLLSGLVYLILSIQTLRFVGIMFHKIFISLFKYCILIFILQFVLFLLLNYFIRRL
ncbi:MAG TPA: oligosaccharide flippase family protein [Treponemataceae bacterium]|nr:oligosaccharide flippase family protein [Treponemataceae bacterium]